MSYSAVAFDLDGTLLTKQGTILPENLAAIAALRAKGIRVFIVTGRHHTAVRPYYAQLQLDTPVVCCNGTYIYDFQTESVGASNPLDQALAAEIIEKAKAEGIHTAIYTRDAMTYEVLNPHFTRFSQWVAGCPEAVRPQVHQVNFADIFANNTLIWKVLISDPDLVKLRAFEQGLDASRLSIEWSWVDRVDITAAGNNKGDRLRELLAVQGIAPESVVAFGDNFNDVSLFQAVGLGIAMGKAEADVQAAADRVIGDNNTPAIAETLAQLFAL